MVRLYSVTSLYGVSIVLYLYAGGGGGGPVGCCGEAR